MSPARPRWTATACACAVSLLLTACAKEEPQLPEQGFEFWTVPDLPPGTTLEVNGHAADAEQVRVHLLPLWAERWDDLADPEESERAFFADARILFDPLVRQLLLLHEAERRWPALDESLATAADAEWRRGSAELYQMTLERLGEAGIRAQLERTIRLRLLFEAFATEAEPVTDDEVYERYLAQSQGDADPAELVQRGVNYEESAPRLRAELEHARASALQSTWIEARLPTARVRAVVPGGIETSW